MTNCTAKECIRTHRGTCIEGLGVQERNMAKGRTTARQVADDGLHN